MIYFWNFIVTSVLRFIDLCTSWLAKQKTELEETWLEEPDLEETELELERRHLQLREMILRMTAELQADNAELEADNERLEMEQLEMRRELEQSTIATPTRTPHRPRARRRRRVSRARLRQFLVGPPTSQGPCSICHCEFTGDVRKLCCGHEFHVNCVDEWLANSVSCPNCRHDVTKRHPTEATTL
jgi:hypothetical protein